VPVRGVSIGSTVLIMTAIHDGQTVSASVPVMVRPAP
jgi:hypothetical protein